MRSGRRRSDPQKTLLGFFVGDVHYAIAIHHVLQIVNPLPITALPHLPDELTGVAEHRGDIVPVVDLRLRFGLPSCSRTRKAKWVLVDVEGRTAALIVDAITDVFGTDGTKPRPAPTLAGHEKRGIIGVTTCLGRLTFLLDVLPIRVLLDVFSASERISEMASLMPSIVLPSLGSKP